MKIDLNTLTKLSITRLDQLIEEKAMELWQVRAERRRRIEHKRIQEIINCPNCINHTLSLCDKHDSVRVQPKV